ncbi:MAG: response regulator [Pseudoxanthomonas sp.]
MSDSRPDAERIDGPAPTAALPPDLGRILVAEDNAMNQKVILRQLMLLGFEADMAGDGREALIRWQRGHYALLLSDLQMPLMDGFELTTAIRAGEQAGGPRLPIIALTANAMQGEAKRCRDAGMDGYLSKPLQLGDLKTMLQIWLPGVFENAAVTGGSGLRARAQTPVDVRVLEDLVGQDRVVNLELLAHFQVSAAQIAGQLAQHCAGRQSLLASEQAHKLGSAARAVGALGLGDCCAEMEITGKNGDSEALAELWKSFERELEAVNDFLDAMRRTAECAADVAPVANPLEASRP